MPSLSVCCERGGGHQRENPDSSDELGRRCDYGAAGVARCAGEIRAGGDWHFGPAVCS